MVLVGLVAYSFRHSLESMVPMDHQEDQELQVKMELMVMQAMVEQEDKMDSSFMLC